MQKHKFDINVAARSINFYVYIYLHKFFIDIKNINLAAARSILNIGCLICACMKLHKSHINGLPRSINFYVDIKVYIFCLHKNLSTWATWAGLGRQILYAFMHCINTYKKVDGRRLAVRLPGRHPDCSHFFFGQITQQSTSTMLKMPRAKGKANYKVDIIIQVVESVLPNGMQSWQEVATIYQHRSGELILRDHDDIKRHWIEKCCYKFKKLTGDPGDPKRDMILRCQRIHQRIQVKIHLQSWGQT